MVDEGKQKEEAVDDDGRVVAVNRRNDDPVEIEEETADSR